MMSSTDSFTRVNVIAMRFQGRWSVPSFGKYVSLVHQGFGVFITICFGLFTAMMFADIVINRDDLTAVIENLSISLLYFCSVLKSVVFLLTRKTMEDLVKHAGKFYRRVELARDPKALEILEEYVKQAKFVTYVFWYAAFLTITGFCGIPLIDVVSGAKKEPTHLVFRAWTPFSDIWSAYLLQLVLAYLAGIITGSLSTLTAVLVIIATCEIKILSIELEGMIEAKDRFDEQDRDLKEKIVYWVEKHSEVIRYVERLDGILNHVLLLDFVVYSGLFCTIFFQYTVVGFKFESIVSISYFGVMINQLMLIYWTGNEIKLHSELLASAAYNSIWYKAPAWYKTNMKIIIQRCQKPLKLRVWKLYDISLETFLKIMSAAYSYFAILRHVYSEK